MLDALRAATRLADDTRIYLEANPEDVSAESVAAWRRIGIDTLSLGIQSLDAADLEFLGRSHGPERAREAAGLARAAGFSSLSIDLIYGLPGQTPRDWRRRIGLALDSAVVSSQSSVRS